MTFKKFALITTALSLPMAAVADNNFVELDQRNSNDVAVIDQSAADNSRVGIAVQRGGVVDTLTITQMGDSNNIDSVDQNGQVSFGNTATITQDGVNNVIGSVVQRAGYGSGSSGNEALVVMTGTDNYIARISQDRQGNTPPGNFLDVNINGADNGQRALDGFAAGSGAVTSRISQGAGSGYHGGNMITLDIDADNTAFGIRQVGSLNTVGTIAITGNDNSLGVSQNGTNNVLGISAIAGVSNNIGIDQLGDTNSASVVVLGDLNAFGVAQDGVSNSATLTVDGNSNGGVGTAPEFGALGLTEGLVSQVGMDNVVTASFTGNDNMFGMLQLGDGNTITGTTAGDANVVAISQVGSSNTANFSQTGNGNIASISQ